jgi:hypothetical protein
VLALAFVTGARAIYYYPKFDEKAFFCDQKLCAELETQPACSKSTAFITVYKPTIFLERKSLNDNITAASLV